MFGTQEQPNIGADEFPSSEELQQNQEYQQSLENQRNQVADQFFAEETQNAADPTFDYMYQQEV